MYKISLDEQHQRYSEQADWTKEIRKYLFSRVPIQTKNNVLEVGSGTGAVMQSLLEEGDFSITGVDIDQSVLRYAQKQGETFRLIQATGVELPFPANSFKISYCHYLLLWTSNPERILLEMRRVTQPGGCVIALAEPDYGSRIDYPPPLDLVGEQQTQALQAQGADTSMGRKLSTTFCKVGLEDVQIGILGASWKTGSNQENIKTEWMTIHSDLEGILTEEDFSTYRDIEESAWKHGSRVLFIPTFYAVGSVK